MSVPQSRLWVFALLSLFIKNKQINKLLIIFKLISLEKIYLQNEQIVK